MKTMLACAACYGQSDSAMAAGMNWGIFSLLAIIVLVLGGVAGFFIFLARRAGSVAATGELAEPADDADQTSRDWVGVSKTSASVDDIGLRGIKSIRSLPSPPHACAPGKSGSRKSGPLAQPRF